ncbi:hypothetical protein ACP3TW_15470 [Enterobacter ludwigii]|uniref:hypothetical protein n=1 Tax=Enterobacter ludwigii TaxID=299767 RepID=UPI003CF0DDF1
MNMIELNKKFFHGLYSEVFSVSNNRYHACITTTDEEQKFIKDTKEAQCYQSLNLSTALLKLTDGRTFLAIKGSPHFEELPPGLELQLLDDHSGVITILGGIGFLSFNNLDIMQDKNWSIIDNSEPGNKDDVTYIEQAEILNIVDDFSVYEVIQSPFEFKKETVDRFLLLFLILFNIGDTDKLSVKNELLSIVTTLDKFPFHLLHSSYISQTWQYSYIDLYRCIELLYPIPRMIKLRKALSKRGESIDFPAIDFFKDVNDTLGWRENEQNGLENIVLDANTPSINFIFTMLEKVKAVNERDTSIINELKKSEIMRDSNFKNILEQIRDLLTSIPPAQMPFITDYKTKKSAKLIANFLYSARNELVHFRTHENIHSETQIKAAFKAMVILLNDAYHKHELEAYPL